jgi:hypothetical protein
MAHPPPQSHEEDLVDEAADESFPASDAPPWTAMHAGAPSPRPWTADHGQELRASLRTALERLAGTPGETEHGGGAPEEWVARAMLDAGRAVVREPIGDTGRPRNVEAELIGAERDAPGVIVGARYDGGDPGAVALELAVVRALARERLRRTLRFVAFAAVGGSERYVERLRRDQTPVHAMLALAEVDLSRTRGRATLLFVGNFRSWPTGRAARDAFRSASRIPARALALPSWLAPGSPSDATPFWRNGWPGVTVTDRWPWLSTHGRRLEPDVDQMAAAVPGLVAAIVRLAGGRA